VVFFTVEQRAMTLPDDPILLELVPEFVVSWRRDIAEQLPAIVAERNRDELYRFGHTLKGSARQFGFAELADIGAEIMSIARENLWDRLDETIATARELLDALELLARQHGMTIPTSSSTNL
jgi:HPt (histidine-containing phosphotransfer) domain-containing protein